MTLFYVSVLLRIQVTLEVETNPPFTHTTGTIKKASKAEVTHPAAPAANESTLSSSTSASVVTGKGE